MNPALVAGLYRWGAILLIGIALFGMGFLKGCQHEQAKLEAFEAGVKALGDAQVAKTKQINQQQHDNLKQVTHDLLENVQAAGDVAVDNYRARYPASVQQCPGRSTVPDPAASQQGNDGAGGERVAADPPDPFVQACARDAARLGAWIQYCTLNHCPIGD